MEDNNCHNIQSSCQCSSKSSNPTVHQTLTEVEFERGIWNAVIYNETEKVNAFISKGKTMDRDNFGYTALHYAVRNGNQNICEMLILRGNADVNAVTNGGATPLHRAAMMGHESIVKLLLQKKANVLLQDDDGQTALHRAAAKANFPVCKLLLEEAAIGKDLKTLRDNKNHTSYDVLPTSAHDDLKSLLGT